MARTVREQYELMEKKCELPTGIDPIAVYVNGTRIDNAYHPDLWEAEVEDYEIDEENGTVYFDIVDKRVDYKGDNRTITLENLEKVLCNKYGWSDYDKESGCNSQQGGWFSIDRILEAVADSRYLEG